MAKRNFFGELRLQPEDDLTALWVEEFEPEASRPKVYANFIEEDAENGWTCTLADDEGNESEAHDFATEEELRGWLRENGVEYED